jgi:soluble epoxide hydrolase/lipid-phosphate phosphatase
MFRKWNAPVAYKFFKDKKHMLADPIHISDQDLIVTEKELSRYVNEFSRSGFDQALNWYRTREINYEDEKDIKDVNVHVPVLMITAGKDPVLTPAMSSKMEKFIKNLTREHVEYAAHWVHVEQPDQVNRALLSWLKKLHLKEDYKSKL